MCKEGSCDHNQCKVATVPIYRCCADLFCVVFPSPGCVKCTPILHNLKEGKHDGPPQGIGGRSSLGLRPHLSRQRYSTSFHHPFG